ncbi:MULTISPECIES: sugar phosphate isomerase/epimerase family protein [Roseobacter]|uniref:sugar phosphate isomerase/epimerase family protein n=1 Tax=Roseobacter TaxID=2433 RepID=UPI001BBBAAEE|nr:MULTISPECIES: sugar phosphate isomerase/epimerase [Roseobacter]GIT85692.1 xylose isomerase [Roseobacter sp. OBYS 0001]
MRRLQVYQSLWSMQPHDASGEVLPLDRVAGMVADAGYAGLAIDLGAADVEVAHAVRPHLEREGLTPLIVAFPRSVESLRETLIMAQDFGAPYVNVVGQVFPLTVEGAIPIIRKWIEMSDQIGMPVHFETHRNCITNDLFATLSMLDAIPEMRLAADLSHYMVDREFKLPLAKWERDLMSRCLARADSFQGRIASRQQIQLQIDFPQHAKWVTLFQEFWREGLADWRVRNAQGDVVFLCELGPPEYAMTGGDGREMSNRWEEALKIKAMTERIWADLGGNT